MLHKLAAQTIHTIPTTATSPSLCPLCFFWRGGGTEEGLSGIQDIGLGHGKGVGGYIKTDTTQVVHYSLCLEETLNCSGSTSFTLFFPSLFTHTQRTCVSSG